MRLAHHYLMHTGTRNQPARRPTASRLTFEAFPLSPAIQPICCLSGVGVLPIYFFKIP